MQLAGAILVLILVEACEHVSVVTSQYFCAPCRDDTCSFDEVPSNPQLCFVVSRTKNYPSTDPELYECGLGLAFLKIWLRLRFDFRRVGG